MNIAPLGEVKAKFSAYVKKAQAGPIIVTKNGKPVVLMVQIKDEEDLDRLLLAHSPTFQALLDTAEQRIQDTGGIGHKDVWSKVGSKKSRS